MRRSTIYLSVLILGLGFVSSADAQRATFQSMVVFGDSLSDVGNDFLFTQHLIDQGVPLPAPIPFATRYADGRFTNGPVWVDYIAEDLHVRLQPSQAGIGAAGNGSFSFAYGGAGSQDGLNPTPGGFPVPGLRAQVNEYVGWLAGQGRSADPRALYVVWSGANDYLLGLTTDVAQVVGDLAAAVRALYGAGARTIVLANLPDLGEIPLANAPGVDAAALSALTRAHNETLAAALDDLDATLSGLRIYRVDVYRLFKVVLGDPGKYGFSTGVVAGPATGCLLPPHVCSPVPFETEAFFWDEQHPSTVVHRMVADVVRGMVFAGPVPAPVPALTVFPIGAASLVLAWVGLAFAAGRRRA